MAVEVVLAGALALCAAGWSTTALVLSRRNRRAEMAVVSATDRLRPSAAGERGLEPALGRLDRAVTACLAGQAESAVAEMRLAAALGAIEDGVIVLDGLGATVFQNAPAAAFSGGRHGDALIESAVERLSARALSGTRAVESVDLFGPPRRTIVLAARPLGSADGGGALILIEDVTESRRVDAVRRDFVANISHELKTPIGGLCVLAETLLDESEPAVTARLADRIHVEAVRASRTIDDLLELSRIEAGEAMVQDLVPVADVLDEAVERADAAAEHRSIRIENLPAKPSMLIRGDRRQMVSALFNLLDNAIKYSADGSTVRLQATTSGSTVRISVTDQGAGIPRRDLERVFERFYRVDRARSRDTGGTGLGLAIVRHVAHNHGGEVEVDSVEGRGSTFTLVMPADASRPDGSGSSGGGIADG